MNYLKKDERIVATKEKSAGNGTVGSMPTETKTFPKNTPIETIVDWVKDANGKLIITIDEPADNDGLF